MGKLAQDAPGLRREVGELAAQCRSSGLRAPQMQADACNGGLYDASLDVANELREVGFRFRRRRDSGQ